MHGFEVIVVEISAPVWRRGVCCTSIAVWVYCAIVRVFTPFVSSIFFVRMAFAERACVLAFVAHFASPFWVGHFDFCTVLRVWKCIADIRFLINFKAGLAKTANYITRWSS